MRDLNITPFLAYFSKFTIVLNKTLHKFYRHVKKMILQFKQQAVIKSLFVKNYKNMRKEKLIKITII